MEKPNPVFAHALQQAIGGANPQHGGTFLWVRLYHRDFKQLQRVKDVAHRCPAVPGLPASTGAGACLLLLV
ncbi:hypothetical protein EN809_008915 [Mesorhizobium sp. M2E.F.Ca.ET.166.01.1.1]|nr:hypothetical protein EN862_001645 [Mesorhizobium sp. M2E.F.Ca.ET.219.01.1.1]TGT77672.1 hypothetical protein EN809_008915 [Mesorhizobium sp. M2E.F.Ca.ET.166.01.1.1]TGW03780.1 hypothetical protein EN797_008915 [Mesorhizobium sp. M2E.F.Ca.ET.154.01.1.1]